MSVGSISLSGTSIAFACVQTAAGTINDKPVTQEEEHITPGVNGRRWRDLFEQYEPFEMVTYVECADYGNGVIAKRNSDAFRGKLVSLSVVIAGVTYVLRNAHVIAAMTEISPGPLYGAGIGSGLAHARIAWQIVGTEFAP